MESPLILVGWLFLLELLEVDEWCHIEFLIEIVSPSLDLHSCNCFRLSVWLTCFLDVLSAVILSYPCVNINKSRVIKFIESSLNRLGVEAAVETDLLCPSYSDSSNVCTTDKSLAPSLTADTDSSLRFLSLRIGVINERNCASRIEYWEGNVLIDSLATLLGSDVLFDMKNCR